MKQKEDLMIKCRSIEQSVSELSGGNKQKVVFGKWIGAGSDILILDCPTRGVDIGVKQAMYQLIYQMKKEGKSFVLISEELAELIGMSDRLIMMKDGNISGEEKRRQAISDLYRSGYLHCRLAVSQMMITCRKPYRASRSVRRGSCPR